MDSFYDKTDPSGLSQAGGYHYNLINQVKYKCKL